MTVDDLSPCECSDRNNTAHVTQNQSRETRSSTRKSLGSIQTRSSIQYTCTMATPNHEYQLCHGFKHARILLRFQIVLPFTKFVRDSFLAGRHSPQRSSFRTRRVRTPSDACSCSTTRIAETGVAVETAEHHTQDVEFPATEYGFP